jgi:hypothetical protein
MVVAVPSAPAGPRGGLVISTLSANPGLVSGSEALVRVDVPDSLPLPEVRVQLNGRDVSGVFRATGRSTLTGLVTGLRLGRNSLRASAAGAGGAALNILDHPITGPVFGPQQQPFICQTQAWRAGR